MYLCSWKLDSIRMLLKFLKITQPQYLTSRLIWSIRLNVSSKLVKKKLLKKYINSWLRETIQSHLIIMVTLDVDHGVMMKTQENWLSKSFSLSLKNIQNFYSFVDSLLIIRVMGNSFKKRSSNTHTKCFQKRFQVL